MGDGRVSAVSPEIPLDGNRRHGCAWPHSPPHLRYVHSNGWIESRADVLRDLADSTLVYHKVSVQGDTVTVVGSTAVVTGRGIFDVSLRGERYQFNLLYTEVYVREDERWWLVQRHACKAP